MVPVVPILCALTLDRFSERAMAFVSQNLKPENRRESRDENQSCDDPQ